MEMVKLNNGVEMPMVGYGTYQITEAEQCRQSVAKAIDVGYRLIDTAQAYGNEEYVGAGIKKSGVPRQDIFLATKVWFRSYEEEACRASLQESMKKLQTDYLDLVLLHWPFGNTYAAWRVLEEFYLAGKIRAIGVSNYTPSQLIDLIHFNKVVPAVNQIETNLVCQQREMREWVDKYQIVHQAYAPLGQGRAKEMFEHPALQEIAKAHGKTVYQTALRFLVQDRVAVIPKSVHESRMRENLDVMDFELTEEEMTMLRGMDENRPLIGSAQDPAIAAFAMTW